MGSERRWLDQTYEIVVGPASPSWEEYERTVMEAWRALLDRDPAEADVQSFLEKHPGLLPGYRSMTVSSGHSCHPRAVITQPPLTGLTKKIPDFMWIAQTSDCILPALIEIEKPGRRWFKANGDPTSEFTHARQQLATWRSWFQQPTNQLWFREYYELTELLHRESALRPAYVLIYGRRSEFLNKPELNRVRTELPSDSEHFMTFDRLALDSWSMDFVTCRKPTPHGYEVVAVPATLGWGPRYMDKFARMTGWEAAISRCDYVSEERRAFLLERMDYWFTWARNPDSKRSITSGGRE